MVKLTPAKLIEAPVYYVDHFHTKYDVDKIVILRDGGFVNDKEVMPETLKTLPALTNILDFTNNNLDEFPNLNYKTSLHTLLLSRNQIRKLDGSRLPKSLVNIALAMNNIGTFEQLKGLKSFPKTLRNLNLRGNVVCHLDGYREVVISYCPQLEVLDGERVKLVERKSNPKLLADSNSKPASNLSASKVEDKDIQLMDHVISKMDDATIASIKEQLANAQTLDEIERLEKLLSGGV
ncbi:HER101Cp [Eremothecium sinecaudum]|uniref:U2 small nuclear ribonucleoprotein A' n=1 Tax=Eremothecium sinecaudum TaxID=45286 RepID=A0A0X8HU02_9SACH|nr:HER101Cp [Eremothecium sinecaudum]AMD21380.1 HER101Cp [Eremothecium sinecaudum]